MKTSLPAALALASVLPFTACSQEPPGRSLTVLAAASLTGTFTELADRFEADHPGVTVRLAFDSSATLAQQAVEGAPADVLATADLETMESAAAGGALEGESRAFATNTMVLVVPAANPAGVTSFADLQASGVTYVTCVDTAPCGKVAAELLADAGITHHPASFEPDVKAVLAKVAADEADAGLVYATDAAAAGDQVVAFAVPGAEGRITTYPIATLAQTDDAALATAFVELVLGDQGQQVLAAAGFGRP